jgi:4-carboxymuconolactone decarboxylase
MARCCVPKYFHAPANDKKNHRGAVNNGATEIEIRETLLQTATYSGMPTGVSSFRVADVVIKQLKEEGKLPSPV